MTEQAKNPRILPEEQLRDIEKRHEANTSNQWGDIHADRYALLQMVRALQEQIAALERKNQALQEINRTASNRARKVEMNRRLLNGVIRERIGTMIWDEISAEYNKQLQKQERDDIHRMRITGRIVTEEEARQAYEQGKEVVLYWSDYPESGMAYAGSCVSKKLRETFEGQHKSLEDAIFTIQEGENK